MKRTEFEKWNAPGSEGPDSGRRNKMLLTKQGIKLWASGMIVIIMSTALSLGVATVAEGMSFWELAFIIFVLFPLAHGWVQRWFWKGDDDEPAEL